MTFTKYLNYAILRNRYFYYCCFLQLRICKNIKCLFFFYLSFVNAGKTTFHNIDKKQLLVVDTTLSTMPLVQAHTLTKS